MASLLINDLPMSYSHSTPAPAVAVSSRSQLREASEASPSSSGIVSLPSDHLGITSSQQATPAGSFELQELARMEGAWASMENIGDGLLAGLSSADDEINAPRVQPRSPIHALWPPGLPVVDNLSNSPVIEDAMTSTTSLTVVHLKRENASTDALLLHEALARRNSLETEISVVPKDQEALAEALELLSLDPQPSTLNRLIKHPTLGMSTIRTINLPETTKRVLYALVTGAFTPAQVPAARNIQRFIHDNPDTSIPSFLVTEEIAEIYGVYGWCLIGKCGLERTLYKLTRSSSADKVVGEELEKDQTRRRIELLCGHIRDRHFERMPFQCRLCPASYISQEGLNSHWRTHPLGDFACPACGDIFVSDLSLQRHRHSKHTKGTITARFRRLLARAVPLK